MYNEYETTEDDTYNVFFDLMENEYEDWAFDASERESEEDDFDCEDIL